MDRLLERYMDFVNQNEEDRVEPIGRDIVNRIIEKYDTTNIKPIIKKQTQWNIWREIALRRFPPLLLGETILVKEIKERLGELKKAGYNINSGYSKLRKKDVWDYFRKIRKDISFHFR